MWRLAACAGLFLGIIALDWYISLRLLHRIREFCRAGWRSFFCLSNGVRPWILKLTGLG